MNIMLRPPFHCRNLSPGGTSCRSAGRTTVSFLRSLCILFFALVVHLSWFAPVDAEEQRSVDPAVLKAEADRIAVVDRAKNAVVAIFDREGKGGGSGVVISPDGFALTNFHVVQPCGPAMKAGMADGNVYDAVVVGIDPTGDVALIQLLGRTDFPTAVWGDSDRAQQGDVVFAMGNPFLLASNLQPTVTAGILSGVHRYQPPAGTLLEYTDCLQTDTSINPGNSGGPLFNAQGHLIGINGRCSFEKRGRTSVGVGYAISINQIKNFLGDLHSGRIVDHATLGARVNDADGRVVVADILETSDAFRRGLRYDDELVEFAGRSLNTPNAFKNVLGIYPQGWRIPLSYRRDGKKTDLLVRLASLHNREELLLKTFGPSQELPQEIPPQKNPGKTPPSKEKKPLPEKSKSPNPKKNLADDSKAKTKLPEIVQKHYEQKRGFANYYYNRREQERLQQAWMSRSDLRAANAAWIMSGNLPSGGEFRLVMNDRGLSLKLSASETAWAPPDDFSTSLLPAQSGGLFPALFLWRRLAVEGFQRFGDVYYVGTAPFLAHQPSSSGKTLDAKSVFLKQTLTDHNLLDPNAPPSSGLVDVLAGSYKGVDCRFYFERNRGRLLAMEMYPDNESDPCELHFSDYRQLDGRDLPGQIDIHFGDVAVGTFLVSQFVIDTSGKTADPVLPPTAPKTEGGSKP